MCRLHSVLQDGPTVIDLRKMETGGPGPHDSREGNRRGDTMTTTIPFIVYRIMSSVDTV